MSRIKQSNADVDDREADRMKLEYWPLDRLIPSPRNARTHSDAQIAEVAGSIRAFGFTNPLLVGEDGDVVAGHGRLEAARRLGLTEVPGIPLRGLTELQRRQLMLADNRIALNAGWDVEMLRLELKDLSALGADLSTLGFTSHELAAALAAGGGIGLTDENEVPELADAVVTRAGDIWCLGPHRLVCGDSTDEATVNALLGEAQRAPEGDGPALWGGIRSRVAPPRWRQPIEAAREGSQRSAGGLGSGLGLVSREHSLRLAWRPARGDRGGKLGEAGICDPGSDHLGQGAARHRSRRLSLATRALLVCGSHQG